VKKTLLAAVLLLAAPLSARAQALPAPAASAPSVAVSAPGGDMTLGGVPRLIAQKLEEAKPAGLVDFAGHVGGGAYLPTYIFHDAAGNQYVEAADIGYRAIQGSKPSVYLMPIAINVTALSSRAWDFQWARDHVTRSPYPDLWLGVGPLLPLDKSQLEQLKLYRPKDWLAASASVRFK
jgi:hypothetical protein